MGGPACQGEILPRVLDVSTYLLAFARLTSGSCLTMDDSPDAKSIMKKKRGTEPPTSRKIALCRVQEAAGERSSPGLRRCGRASENESGHPAMR
jgi:hypothetical protein